MVKENNYEKKIVSVLKKNSQGLTITDIVNLSNLSRSTVRTILAKFEGAKKVVIRSFGNAKVYNLK